MDHVDLALAILQAHWRSREMENRSMARVVQRWGNFFTVHCTNWDMANQWFKCWLPTILSESPVDAGCALSMFSSIPDSTLQALAAPPGMTLRNISRPHQMSPMGKTVPRRESIPYRWLRMVLWQGLGRASKGEGQNWKYFQDFEGWIFQSMSFNAGRRSG